MKRKLWAGMLICLAMLLALGTVAQAEPALSFERGQISAAQMGMLSKDAAMAVKPVRSMKLSSSRISVTQGKTFTITMTISPSFKNEAQLLALLSDISIMGDSSRLEPVSAVVKGSNKVALKFRAIGRPGTTTLKFRANVMHKKDFLLLKAFFLFPHT